MAHRGDSLWAADGVRRISDLPRSGLPEPSSGARDDGLSGVLAVIPLDELAARTTLGNIPLAPTVVTVYGLRMVDIDRLEITVQVALAQIREEYGEDETTAIWEAARRLAGSSAFSISEAIHRIADERHPEAHQDPAHDAGWARVRSIEVVSGSGRLD